jgi:hypothetical protein
MQMIRELDSRGHTESLQLILHNRFSTCEKVNSEDSCEKALKLSVEELADGTIDLMSKVWLGQYIYVYNEILRRML